MSDSVTSPGNILLIPKSPEIFPGSYAIGSPHHFQPTQYASPLGLDVAASFAPGTSQPQRISVEADGRASPGRETQTTLLAPRDAVLLAPTDTWQDAIKDIFTLQVWMNPLLWKAGLVEFAASMAFAFVTGAIGVTVSSYPVYVLGPAVFVGNTAAVSLFIYAISTSTGAHINPIISIATAFTGLCHPVRSIIYVMCGAAGSIIGGAFLRGGLGYERALAVHNGGCWLDPNGPMSVGQAVCIEFIGAFCLLFVAFGVGLDPRQKELYGASFGPLLVGATVGLITSATSNLNPGYTGAGIFPGRCLGLQVGLGHLERHDWIWWVPDIAAALVHAVVYHIAPPYTKQLKCPPPVIKGEKAA
ncbi:hypothetical protein FRC03_007916 [Tulasnella sp. 419]|nr:hypothetical protein FRC02_011698 [Tulasnella sp. 418]KAG8959489.1 hypothetical protein FRC03_007916 [Tulasnella sp. 419]